MCTMADSTIHTFREPFVAIYRPNKKTYSILQWVDHGRYWKRYLVDPLLVPTVTLRTQSIPLAYCEINTYAGNTNQAIHVRCVASGQYLRYGAHDVAIIQKKPTSPATFGTSLFVGEFPCTTVSQETPGTLQLWNIRSQDPVYTHVSSITRRPQPLPTRIAWIIAEDASKKGETCPIILDAISPITASVTTCYHVFDSTALTKWFENNNRCPMCKQITVATVAYDGPKDAATDQGEDQGDTDTALRLAAHITYPDIVEYT